MCAGVDQGSQRSLEHILEWLRVVGADPRVLDSMECPDEVQIRDISVSEGRLQPRDGLLKPDGQKIQQSRISEGEQGDIQAGEIEEGDEPEEMDQRVRAGRPSFRAEVLFETRRRA